MSKNSGGRPRGELTRCSGTMTEGKFREFIKSLLRKGSTRWKPIQVVQKKARVARGIYTCVGYNRPSHEAPVTAVIDGKRKKNILVDHIIPVMSPDPSENDWDSVVNRMFVEEDGLQILCTECHREKTNEELAAAAVVRRKIKEGLQ